MKTITYCTYVVCGLIGVVIKINANDIDNYLTGTVESREFDTHCLYHINLTKLPTSTIRQDFEIDTFASNFLKISTKSSNISWKVKLIKDLPIDRTFYLDYSAERITIKNSNEVDEPMYSEWRITVLVPTILDHSMHKSTLKAVDSNNNKISQAN